MGKDPVVNAIIRGVYTKDEPIDLDSGKYTNRLTLLKVPRLTKKRILRVFNDLPLKSYSGSIKKSTSAVIATIESDTIFNTITMRLSGDAYNRNYECLIDLQDKYEKSILYFNSYSMQKPLYKKYYFPDTNYIKMVIENLSGTYTVDYEVNFLYSHAKQPNIFLNKDFLSPAKLRTFYFKDISMLNRLSYMYYHPTQAIDITFEIFTKYGYTLVENWIKISSENITGIAGVAEVGTLPFTEVQDIKLTVKDNNQGGYLDLNLFFSKILLESQISLNNLAEKNHANLTNVLTSQHHVKTVSSDINLNDLNEKSYNNLADKPDLSDNCHIKTIFYTGNGNADRTLATLGTKINYVRIADATKDREYWATFEIADNQWRNIYHAGTNACFTYYDDIKIVNNELHIRSDANTNGDSYFALILYT